MFVINYSKEISCITVSVFLLSYFPVHLLRLWEIFVISLCTVQRYGWLWEHGQCGRPRRRLHPSDCSADHSASSHPCQLVWLWSVYLCIHHNHFTERFIRKMFCFVLCVAELLYLVTLEKPSLTDHRPQLSVSLLYPILHKQQGKSLQHFRLRYFALSAMGWPSVQNVSLPTAQDIGIDSIILRPYIGQVVWNK